MLWRVSDGPVADLLARWEADERPVFLELAQAVRSVVVGVDGTGLAEGGVVGTSLLIGGGVDGTSLAEGGVVGTSLVTVKIIKHNVSNDSVSRQHKSDAPLTKHPVDKLVRWAQRKIHTMRNGLDPT